MLKVGLSDMGMSIMDIHYSKSRNNHADSQQVRCIGHAFLSVLAW